MAKEFGKGIVIGITGGIACGKSEVGRILEGRGWQILDTDAVAHELMEPGRAAQRRIEEEFGSEYLLGDGRVDRRKLGERVFAQPEDRDRLNRIVHPLVRDEWHQWATHIRREGGRGAVMIPLLFEVGAEKEVDSVVCVAASREVVLARLRERGLDERQSEQRIASQWPVEEKCRRSDFVIENEGTRADLERAVEMIASAILRKEKERYG